MESQQEMDNESLRMEQKVQQSIEIAKENFRVSLRKMTKNEMIDEFRLWSNENLINFCEDVALESEDFEICDAVYIVKKERDLK